jgi:hypothetical protein
MLSPTGYAAFFNVYAINKQTKKVDHKTFDQEGRPVLHWNADGRPVVSDEAGNLVTPEAYLAEYTETDEEHTYRGSFEIQAVAG